MSDQDRWTVDLTDVARDVRRVSRQPAQRVCRGDNVMPSLQEPLDDAIPARPVRESPVYENNRRFVTHLGSSSTSELYRLPSCQSARRSERRPDLLGEQRKLFPCRKVPAPVDLVEVDQVSVGAPGPALRGSIDVVRKDRDA